MKVLLKVAFVLALLTAAGCQQRPPMLIGQAARPGQLPPGADAQLGSAYVQNSAEINRRIRELDVNNRELHSQLAQSQKYVQVLNDELTLVKGQLRGTAERLQVAETDRRNVENRVAAMQASSQKRNGVVIRPNNSVSQSLNLVKLNIPNVDVKMEGDVVRILLPADQIFQAGSTLIQPDAFKVLDEIATVIKSNYPQQRIGIEGHIDGTPGFTPTTLHQLTSAQSLAVFSHFTDRNRLPPQQFVAMAHGANHPRASNSTPVGRAQNRR
ncbi:MAG: flagellar motor protein MotB, partial [Pirellulaceae bacterium]